MSNIPLNLDCSLDNDYTIKLVGIEYKCKGVTPEQCIARKQTYATELWGIFSIVNNTNGIILKSSPKLLANIPMPTVDDEFIWTSGGESGIKANRYVLVKQLVKTPGIYCYIKKVFEHIVHYCLIRPEYGPGILFSKVTTGKGTKSIRLTNEMNVKYTEHELNKVWGKIGGTLSMSRAGKRQMYWASNNEIKGLEVDTTELTLQELSEIQELFNDGKLKIMDDRSLATRRVLRYKEDHLPRLFKRAERQLEKTVKDNWPSLKNHLKEIDTIAESDKKTSKIDALITLLASRLPLQPVFDSFFSTNDLFQLLDTTNPLAELSQKRRLTLKGPGGYPEKAMLLEKRDVHFTDFGRICPVETPQGQDLGFSLYLAKEAKIDEMGFICAKYLEKSSNSVKWLNVYDEILSKAIISHKAASADEITQARSYYGVELADVSGKEITHVMLTPHAHLGYAASLIPFFQHNDANRALMGANMMKQALPLLHKEAPYVVTGLETEVAEFYMQESPFKVAGQLRLGTNLLTGYLPWDFYTYEDAVAVSDSLVRNRKLTHVETEEIYFDAIVVRSRNLSREDRSINQSVYEIITGDSEYIGKISEISGTNAPEGLQNLTLFSEFEPDDILDINALILKLETDIDESTREVSELIWGIILNKSERIIKNKKSTDAQRKFELATCLNTFLHDTAFYGAFYKSDFGIRKEVQPLLEGIPLGNEVIRLNRSILEDAYPQFLKKSSDIIFDGVIREGSEFKPGDLLVSKLRLINDEDTDRTSKFAVDFLKNYITNNTLDIGVFENSEDASLYAAEGISGRIVKVEWVDGVKDKRRLKIVIESKHDAKIGDKLTGRHGNKGVISRIINEKDMPYFYSKKPCCSDEACKIKKAHTHLELLINPLTITSRMNLGQLYETSASWLAVNQGSTSLQVPPFGTDWPWEKIAESLVHHGVEVKHKLYYREGDGEKQSIGDHNGKNGVTVGYQYILKLKHLAEKKNKSRNQSVVSPATGQPITPTVGNNNDIAAIWENRNVRKHSAQRLGEMEVWALQGHEAWHLLDELLFLKSDSNHLKQQMLDAIHESDRSRVAAFREFEEIVHKTSTYTWTIRSQDDYRIVNCNAQNGWLDENHFKWLNTEATELGLKVEQLQDGSCKLTHAPLEIVHRAHQSLKSFVLYCRGLGFEVEGINPSDGKSIKLVNASSDNLPRLHKVGIRVASDDERKKWSGRNILNHRGDNKVGLWPDEWNDPKNRNKTTDKKFNEECDYIELPIHVDSPLFRGVLHTLLSVDGCRVDRMFMLSFQELLINYVPRFKEYSQKAWKNFWETELEKRSRLLMQEDVIEWLNELVAQENPQEETLNIWLKDSKISFSYDFRKALPYTLTAQNTYALFPSTTENLSKIPAEEKDKYADLTEADKASRLHIRDLYRHFELMDFRVLRERLNHLPGSKSVLKKTDKIKSLLDLLIASEFKPTDFFIKNLIVLPRNLRHERKTPRKLSKRSSISHFAFDNDLNYLYQHILIQVEILNKPEFKSMGAWRQAEIEERRLRPLVHALLSNRPEIMTPVKRSSGRQLHGIIDTLAGRTASKEGFFSRHLLGKRLDFSGRAVIIPDPELGIDETSIPLNMGLTIFRDILIKRCMHDPTINPKDEPIFREDGSMTDRRRPIHNALRIAIAKEYIRDKNNLDQITGWLKDASKIHPVLLNRAPSLHRLSILSFYARFHDDDDCIHLNPFVCSPFNADFDGDTMAVHVPFLSSSIEEAKEMLPSKKLRSPGNGKLRIDYKKDHALAAFYASLGTSAKVGTADTVYRLFDAASCDADPTKFGTVTQDELTDSRSRLKQCGFSLGVADFLIEQDIITSEVERARFDAKKLSIKKDITDFWQDESKKLALHINSALKPDSPVKFLIDSGAGKPDLQQLSAIRGIMMKPVDPEMTDDNLVPWPILSSIVTGMTPLEYFVSCHGSRNGLADKGLLTAPAGDITNTMVQAAQGISIIEDDCCTLHGLSFECNETERFIGRFIATNVLLADKTVLNPGDEITADLAEKIKGQSGTILLRSPVTCNSQVKLGQKGICKKCYGRELSAGKLPEKGFPAGIIAAQSIGETGTQLTLSSFHTGGAAGTKKFGIMDVRKQIVKLDPEVEKAFCTGKEAAAIKQLDLLQEMYKSYGIADHHFEVIISTMFASDKIPLRSVLDAAKTGDGFLSRLAFKDVGAQLVNAVLIKAHDDLSDIKSKVMTGQIIYKRGGF